MAKNRSRNIQAQRNQQGQKNTIQATPKQETKQVAETETISQAGTATATAPAADNQTLQQEQPQQALVTTEANEQKAITTPVQYPSWPTSRPGPRATPPPAGMHPLNFLRPEQVAEVAYDQTTGQPSDDSRLRPLPDEDLVNRGQVSLDQQRTAQEEIGKRKKRL